MMQFHSWFLFDAGAAVVALGTLHLTSHFFHFRDATTTQIDVWSTIECLWSKTVEFELDGVSLWLRFDVCDATYSVFVCDTTFFKGTMLNLEGEIVR
jgi:hypothetical protein